ncbi:MAG: hypothetical protein V1720_06890 [bacterium]
MKNIVLIFFFIFSTLNHNDLFACTVFYAAKGNIVLAGNNEDFINTEAYIQFLPAKDGKLGRIYFGFFYEPTKMSTFGGVNEQGLFYDVAALDAIELKEIPEGELYNGNIMEKIMEECSTVEEVIDLIHKYSNFLYITNGQVMFGDKFGNSVIIETEKILKKDGTYQIMTNFRQTDEELKKGNIPCERYKIANSLLKESPEISKDLFQKVLESVHQEGWYATVYSNVYDLKNGIIYLYYFHNFFEEVQLDVLNELAKGERIVKISSLFNNNFAAKAYIDWKNWELENRKQNRIAKNFDTKIIDEYIGKYLVCFYPTKDSLKVINDNGKMVIVFSDTLKIEVFPESNSKFFVATLNGDYEFTFNTFEAENKVFLKIKPTEFGTESTWEKVF